MSLSSTRTTKVTTKNIQVWNLGLNPTYSLDLFRLKQEN